MASWFFQGNKSLFPGKDPKMKYVLLLLPLLSVSTLVLHAQSNWGSGSLVATLRTNGIISLSITSQSEHRHIRYAPAQEIQRFPVRYRGYEPYSFGGWGDWRVVHEKVNELTAKGWELNDLNMSTSGGGECGPLLKHLHYHFYVPDTATLASLNTRNSDQGEVILEATINQGRDFGRQRGALLRKADGTYLLTIERFQEDDFYPIVTIEDEGVVAGNLPSLLEAIEIRGRRLFLEYAAENGRYRYEFFRTGDSYALAGLQFTANNPCGLQELQFANATEPVAPLTQYWFRKEPCDETEPPKRISTRLNIGRYYLSTFTPLRNQVPIEDQSLVLIF